MRKLVIYGNPTLSRLLFIWQSILLEYSELIKTEKTVLIFEAWKKVEYINFKIKMVHITLDFLKDQYDSEIANILVELGYDYVEYNGDKVDYLNRLRLVEEEAKNLIVFLNLYIAEYNALCPIDTAAPRSEIDYEEELVVLGKFAGRKIDKNSETVFEVCAVVNAFIRYNNSKKILKHGQPV